MICGKKLEIIICNKNWEEQWSVSPHKFLEMGLSLEFVKKIVKSFSSKNAIIFRHFQVQHFEKAHKILAPSSEKILLFVFLNKVKKNTDFKKFYFILLQISISNFIPQNIYFFIEKRMISQIYQQEMMLLYPLSLKRWSIVITRQSTNTDI